ncbi:hypothetical protein FQN49_002357 [Arthroderma sp. PD_2]|nr:hypothetical protein FQN49_002357 [Arthroderma sp. PD_2]
MASQLDILPPVTPSRSASGSLSSSMFSPSPTPSTSLVPLRKFPFNKSKFSSNSTDSPRPRRSRRNLIVLIIGIMTILITTLIVTLVLVLDRKGTTSRFQGPLVDLGYAKYMGVPGGYNVTSWLGMRYAAPPVGDLRFSAPQDPEEETGIQLANNRGKYCIPTSGKLNKKRMSEDCLHLNVFAPTHAGQGSKLPVFFFILGGGYNLNSDPFLNGTGLITASEYNMVVVTFTYRVSLYGFLPGKEIEKGGSLNNGLKDQIKALQWVKKHISKFGGDPDHVVIGGHSAGAASVAHLLTAYGGRDDGLFHGAIAGSPSFGTTLTSGESQYLYDSLTNRTGCNTQSDSLACLRKLDVEKLQGKNIGISLPDSSGPPLFSYSPVVDGDLIQEPFYKLFNQGKVIDVPTVIGSDSNEGSIFAPHKTKSQEAGDRWLSRQFPALKPDHLTKIHSLYPKPEFQFRGAGAFWKQLSDIYGEMRYICPAISICKTMGKEIKNKVWNYEYNVQDPRLRANGFGATHTAEINAIFDPSYLGRKPKASYLDYVNGPVVPVVQGYWTSFIRSLDPNKHRADGSPEWTPSSSGNPSEGIQRLFFKTNATKMITEDEESKKRCEYLSSIGPDLKQ